MTDESSPLLRDEESRAVSSTDTEAEASGRGVAVINDPLDLKGSSSLKAYKRRFYILSVYCLFGLLQATLWNTWGPISDTVITIYGWDNTILAMFPNWTTILFLIAFIPMIKLLLRFGLRVTVLHCSFLLLIGSGLRCIPCSDLLKTVFANVCAVLTGYCGTLTMTAPTVLTATWFPPNERTTATAMMTMSNGNIAVSFSFLIAKLMVRNLNTTSENETVTNSRIATMRGEVDRLMYVECGIAIVLFLFVLCYFPKKPSSPPTSSATVERVPLKDGARMLFKQRNFWLILIPYALVAGGQDGFTGVLNVALRNFDITQEESDWLGVYTNLLGIPSGILFSRLADYRKRWMRRLLIFAMFFAGVTYLWFTLICFGVMPYTPFFLYISILLGGFFSNATYPLLYELNCEVSYPVSEGIVTGFMAAAENVTAGIFLLAVMVKVLGTLWIMVYVPFVYFLSIPLLLATTEEYRRVDLDIDNNVNNIDQSGSC